MPLYEVRTPTGTSTITSPNQQSIMRNLEEAGVHDYSIVPLSTAMRRARRTTDSLGTVSRRQNVFGFTDEEERQHQKDIFG